jgi:hypothetical protein
VGYPLLKGVAEYWIHELVPDQYFNDSTLVAAPCNSPEHGWTVSLHDPTYSHPLFLQALTIYRHLVALIINR